MLLCITGVYRKCGLAEVIWSSNRFSVVPGRRNSNPTPAVSPERVCHAIPTFYYYKNKYHIETVLLNCTNNN